MRVHINGRTSICALMNVIPILNHAITFSHFVLVDAFANVREISFIKDRFRAISKCEISIKLS